MRKGGSAVSKKAVAAADDTKFVEGFLTGEICATDAEAAKTTATTETVKEAPPNTEHHLPGHVTVKGEDAISPSKASDNVQSIRSSDLHSHDEEFLMKKLPTKLDSEFKTALVKKADGIASRSHSVPPTLIKRPLRTDDQTYAEMEKLKVQQDAIREARVLIASTTKLGNNDKIRQLLYGTVNAEKPDYEYGDEETYLKVNEVVKSHVFIVTSTNAADDTATLEQRVTSTREQNDAMRKKIREIQSELKQSTGECKSLRLLLEERNEETLRLRQQVQALQLQLRNAQNNPTGTQLSMHRHSFTAVKKAEARENEILDLQRDFAQMAEANWKLEQENKSLRVRIATSRAPAESSPRTKVDFSNILSAAAEMNAADPRSRQMFMTTELPQTSKIVQLGEARRVWMKRLQLGERGIMGMLDFDANQASRKTPTLFGVSGMVGERGRRSTVDEPQRVSSSVFEDVVSTTVKRGSTTTSGGIGRSNSVAFTEPVSPAPATTPTTASPASSSTTGGSKRSSTVPPPAKPSAKKADTTPLSRPQDTPETSPTTLSKLSIAPPGPKVKTENCWAALRATVQSHFLVSKAECLRREEAHVRKARQKIAVLSQELETLMSERDAAYLKVSILERNLAQSSARLHDSSFKCDSLNEELERARKDILRLQGAVGGTSNMSSHSAATAAPISLTDGSKRLKSQLKRLEQRHLIQPAADSGEKGDADVQLIFDELRKANADLESRLASLNKIFDSRVAALQGELAALEEQNAVMERRTQIGARAAEPTLLSASTLAGVSTPFTPSSTSAFQPAAESPIVGQPVGRKLRLGTMLTADSSAAVAAASNADTAAVKQLQRQVENLKEDLAAANRHAEGLRLQVQRYEDIAAEKKATNALGFSDRTAAVVIAKVMRWCTRSKERLRRRQREEEHAAQLQQQQLQPPSPMSPMSSVPPPPTDPDGQLLDVVRELIGGNPGCKFLLEKLHDVKLRADAAIKDRPEAPTEASTNASRLRRAFLKLLIHREEMLLDTNSCCDLVEKTYAAMLRCEKLVAPEYSQLAVKAGASVYQQLNSTDNSKDGADDEPMLMDMRSADQATKESRSLKALLATRIELAQAIDSHRASMLARSDFSATMGNGTSIVRGKSVLGVRHVCDALDPINYVLVQYGIPPNGGVAARCLLAAAAGCSHGSADKIPQSASRRHGVVPVTS